MPGEPLKKWLDNHATARSAIAEAGPPSEESVGTPYVEIVPELGFVVAAEKVAPCSTPINAWRFEESWRAEGLPTRLIRRTALDVATHIETTIATTYLSGTWTTTSLEQNDQAWLQSWRTWLSVALTEPELGDLVEAATPTVLTRGGTALTTLTNALDYVPEGFVAWARFGPWVAPVRLGRKSVNTEAADLAWFRKKFTGEGRLRLASFGMESLEAILFMPKATLFAAWSYDEKARSAGANTFAATTRDNANDRIAEANTPTSSTS